MTSRWMLQVQQRQSQFRKRQGNLSMTRNEEKFYRRKVRLLDNGALLVESIEDHIERMEMTAELERSHPTEWWRMLARISEVIPSPYSIEELKLIDRACAVGSTVSDVEAQILHYRATEGKLDRIEELKKRYKQIQRARREEEKALIDSLVESGQVNKYEEGESSKHQNRQYQAREFQFTEGSSVQTINGMKVYTFPGRNRKR